MLHWPIRERRCFSLSAQGTIRHVPAVGLQWAVLTQTPGRLTDLNPFLFPIDHWEYPATSRYPPYDAARHPSRSSPRCPAASCSPRRRPPPAYSATWPLPLPPAASLLRLPGYRLPTAARPPPACGLPAGCRCRCRPSAPRCSADRLPRRLCSPTRHVTGARQRPLPYSAHAAATRPPPLPRSRLLRYCPHCRPRCRRHRSLRPLRAGCPPWHL